MSKPNVHVTFDSDSKRWKVSRAGASRASGYYPTAADALDAGRDTARRERVELIKHRKDNSRIHQRDSYGNDPYPPRG